jgi:peptidoglycan/xylan/chitin deacetylase (PgdA/CDA1 family)
VLFQRLFALASPAGRKARLSILIFHRVLPARDPLFPEEPDLARFDEIMGWVKAWFRVLPLDEAVARLKTGALPARSAAISFDDGYADNFENAAPILRKHGLTATFFVAPGFLDGGRMWNDTVIEAIRACPGEALDLRPQGLGFFRLDSMDARRQAIDTILPAIKYLPAGERIDRAGRIARLAGADLPPGPMMTSEQVRRMYRSGMLIGAHTMGHPILARLGIAEAREEIAESKHFLENLLGARIGLFAYPNGKPGTDFLAEHAELVKALGFDAAFSTAHGCATGYADPFQLPRFTPWGRTRKRFAMRLLRNMRGQGVFN